MKISEFFTHTKKTDENPVTDTSETVFTPKISEEERAENRVNLPEAVPSAEISDAQEGNSTPAAPFFSQEEITDAHAGEEPVLTAEEVAAQAPLYSNVILALKTVYDPEIPVNIYDLGLVYEIFIHRDNRVDITMTFTAPTCPMADEVVAEVQRAVEDVPGITGCRINLVFEPVWDQSMLSDEARLILGLD